MGVLLEAGYELLIRASTDLPQEVEEALREARDKEAEGSAARSVLGTILENVALARKARTPICQDTGQVNFFVKLPRGTDMEEVEKELVLATQKATKDGYLRPNTVDPVYGKNPGDNTGPGWPHFEFEFHDSQEIRIDVLLKGGGSENVGAQYKLPDGALKAGRDLEGVRRVIIDAVYQAQGKGCAPGIVGIGIGGDRAMSYLVAKKQLLRPLKDENPDPRLAEFETRLYEELNELGIGPMGFGGKTTVLGVKAGYAYRHPATFFVSMAYFCWAARHRVLIVRGENFEIR